MPNNNNKLHKAIKAAILLLAFLVPIFFLPITLEAFEFNKMYLVTFITSICLLLWGVQVITQKNIKVAKTSLLIPGTFLGIAVLLSTIFSIDKTSSIFGATGRWYPSLVSFLTMGALYIVATTHLTEKKDTKNALMALVSGITLSSIIALLSFFGILFIQGTDRNFNPMGSLLTLGILAVLAIVAGIYTILKEDDRILRVAGLLIAIPNFAYIALYDNIKVWGILALGVILLASFTKKDELAKNRLHLVLLGIFITLMVGATTLPQTKNIISRHEYPQEVQVPFRESWNIAISSMRDFPLVGTGPSTFYLNYPRYRSIAMNRTDFWNARFDKPYNELLLIVSSLGLVGIVAAGYFVATTTKITLGAMQRTDTHKLVGALATLLLVTLLFTHATVPLGFALTLVLGIIGAMTNMEDTRYISFVAGRPSESETFSLNNTPHENEGFLTAVLALPLIALAGLGFVTIYKIYPGEYYMQRALQTLNTDVGQSYEYQTRAIRHNPRRSNYYNTFAQTNLAIAINLSNQENLTENDGQTVQELISTAISATKVASESINPLNPINWEIQANIYRAIRAAAQDADQWAVRALEAAIQLDPANPRLRLELGGIYYAAEDYATAASLFRQAINLKPDYANAYYNFAQAAKNLEDYATAKRALDLTLNLVERESEDAEAVRKEIEELNEILAALGEGEQRPTVEELANQGEIVDQDSPTEQEPLTVEGEREDFVDPIEGTVEEGFEANSEADSRNDTGTGTNTNDGEPTTEMGSEEEVNESLE